MAEYTVRESGGDFPTVAAAMAHGPLADGDTIRVQQAFSGVIDEQVTVNTPNVHVIFEQGAEVDFSNIAGGTHYKHYSSASGHAWTVSAPGLIVEGADIRVANSSGNSAETFRLDAQNHNPIFRRCMIWAETQRSDQDGVYATRGQTAVFEQCVFYNFGRAGAHWQNTGNASDTWNTYFNSCLFYKCGDVGWTERESGGVCSWMQENGRHYGYGLNSQAFLCYNSGNNTSIGVYGGDFAAFANAGRHTYKLTGCIASYPTCFSEHATFLPNSEAIDSIDGVTLTDVASPGAGTWVIVEDLGTSPPNFLLVDNATDNEAQDLHSNGTAYTMTIPSTDAQGNPRSAPYDCGPFTIFTGVGPVILVVDDMLHGHAVDGDLALSAGTILYPNDALHGHAVEGDLALGQGFVISADDAQHGHPLEGDISLGQGAFLTAADILHNHPLEGDLGLSGDVFLTVADMVHGHALEGNLGLLQGSILALADMAHGHAIEGLVPLSQGYALAPADMLHGHGLEGPVALSQGYVLLVADGLHNHIIESPTLVLGSALSVADALQGHSLEGPLGLSQSAILTSANALHGHLLDGVNVIPGFTLTVDNLQHNHPIESPTLIHGLMVMPVDAFHVHQLDGVNVSQSHILVVADCQHLHFVDSVNVIAGEFEPGCVTKVPVENRHILIPIENRMIKIKLC